MQADKEHTPIVVKFRNLFLLILLAALALSVALVAKKGVSTDFTEIFPGKSDSMLLNAKYQDLTAQKLTGVILLAVKTGDIYTPETFARIDRITKKLCNFSGINAPTVKSLTNGSAQYVVNNSEGMFSYGITQEGLPQTPEALKTVRDRIMNAPMVKGIYVADDDKSVAVMADMLKDADVNKLYGDLKKLKAEEEDAKYSLHIFGAPAMASHFGRQMTMAVAAFGVSLLLILLYCVVKFRTVKGILVPLVAVIAELIATLGIASLFGSKMNILFLFPVLFLSAVAMVMAVWFMLRFYASALGCSDTREAAATALAAMTMPILCTVFLIAATGCLLVFAPIDAVRGFGIISICASVVLYFCLSVLAPVLASYGKLPKSDKLGHIAEGFPDRMAYRLQSRSGGLRGLLTIVMVLGIATGIYASMKLTAGGNEFGQAFFNASHDYNQGFSLFNAHYLGGNEVDVVVENRAQQGMRSKADMLRIEKVLGEIKERTDARVTLGMPMMIRMTNMSLHEGNPRWSNLPEEGRDIANLGGMVLLSPDAAPFMSPDWSHALVKVFYPDNDPGKTVERIRQVKAIAVANSGNGLTFHASCGYLAQQNDANASSRTFMLIAALGAVVLVFLIAAVATRSLGQAAQLILPLAFTQSAALLVMVLKDMPANVFTIATGPVVTALAGSLGLCLLLSNQSVQSRSSVLLVSLLLLCFTIPWWFVGLLFMADAAAFTGIMLAVDILLLQMFAAKSSGSALS